MKQTQAMMSRVWEARVAMGKFELILKSKNDELNKI